MYAITLERVSSVKQSDNTSVESQRLINERVLNQKGYTVVMSFSETKSGRGERESVQEAYDFCIQWNKKKRKKISVLAIYDWSRWFRNQDLAGYWRTMFQRIGVEVNATTEWINDDNTGELFIRAFKTAAAEAESMENSKRTRRGMYFTVKKGYLTASAPRGIIKRQEPNGQKKIIDVDPDLYEPYRQAFLRIANEASPTRVFHQLGGKETFGGKSTYFVALRNPVYAGWVHYKSTIEGLPDLTVQLKAHETVTDLDTFNKVQRQLDQNSNSGKTQLSDQLFWAKRSLCCPVCDHPTTSENAKGRSRYYQYYRCGKDHKHFRVSAKEVNRLMSSVIARIGLSQSNYDKASAMLNEKVKALHKQLGEELGRLRRAMITQQEREKRALDLFIDGSIDQMDLNRIKEETKTIQSQIKRKEFLREHQLDITQQALKLMSSLEIAWSSIDHNGKAQLLKMIFPDGFQVEKDKENDYLICRTARLNNVFNILGLKSDVCERLKIEKAGPTLMSPALGERRDEFRTVLDQDIRLFQAFYNSHFVKVA